MRRPPLPADFRYRLRLVACLGLVLTGILAFVLEYKASQGATPLVNQHLTVADFAGKFETAPVEAPANFVFKIRISAPVDNSWMNAHISVFDSSGVTVDARDLKLAFYHGEQDGQKYQSGSPLASVFLRVPSPGSYRFRIEVTAGLGDIAVPQTMLAGKPLHLQILPAEGAITKWRLAGSMAAMASGLTLALSAILGRRCQNGRVRERGTDEEQVTGRVLPQTGGGRMIFLDGLRGVACLAVVVCHFLVPGMSQIAPMVGEAFPLLVVDVLRQGGLGVEIFFVLSGVVIAYSIRNCAVSRSFLWRFAIRRAIRLDPPYYLALWLTVGISAWHLPDTLYELGPYFGGGPGVLANVFYLQNVLQYPQVLAIAWTLCLELQFYLAFVILVWTAQSFRDWLHRHEKWHTLPCGPFAFTAVFGWLVIVSLLTWFSSLRDFTFLGTWFRFFLGAVTCWSMLGRIGREIPGSFILVLLVLGIYTNDLRSVAAALTALVILISHKRGGLDRWLSGPVWQFLGNISYSLYLVHCVVALPLINWLWTLTPQSPATAVSLLMLGVAFSVAAAWLFYFYIERPSIALSRSIPH